MHWRDFLNAISIRLIGLPVRYDQALGTTGGGVLQTDLLPHGPSGSLFERCLRSEPQREERREDRDRRILTCIVRKWSKNGQVSVKSSGDREVYILSRIWTGSTPCGP